MPNSTKAMADIVWTPALTEPHVEPKIHLTAPPTSHHHVQHEMAENIANNHGPAMSTSDPGSLLNLTSIPPALNLGDPTLYSRVHDLWSPQHEVANVDRVVLAAVLRNMPYMHNSPLPISSSALFQEPNFYGPMNPSSPPQNSTTVFQLPKEVEMRKHLILIVSLSSKRWRSDRTGQMVCGAFYGEEKSNMHFVPAKVPIHSSLYTTTIRDPLLIPLWHRMCEVYGWTRVVEDNAPGHKRFVIR